jgi:hypothetical protein
MELVEDGGQMHVIAILGKSLPFYGADLDTVHFCSLFNSSPFIYEIVLTGMRLKPKGLIHSEAFWFCLEVLLYFRNFLKHMRFQYTWRATHIQAGMTIN